ncbi:tannase-domain-containing protein [Apiospora aurea]|uniref:Carboxylic ester hydrolase n=1 Tax=Apiospora aurea TaxID=335848 RepID=A0ABR1Q1C2_9PEZI
MDLLLCPLILLASLPLYQAVNLCPGYAPDPALDDACIKDNFDGIMQQYNATIEAIHRANETLPCYGEDIDKNIFYLNNILGHCNQTDAAFRFDPTCNYALLLAPSCAMIVKKDTYRFGLIMPNATNYTHSFMATGGFSFAGGITWREMWAWAYYYGMAVMSTDQGHYGTQPDMSWARGNDTARKDWGYRALDGSVPIAKSLINQYYGSYANHSYFAGCSTSGRQGLKQLEIDPDAFDGLLIGDPVWDQEPWSIGWRARARSRRTPRERHGTPRQGSRRTLLSVPSAPFHRQLISVGVSATTLRIGRARHLKEASNTWLLCIE